MTRRQVSGVLVDHRAAAADADVVVEEVEAAEAVDARPSTMAWHCASSVRSAWCATAVPPSAAIMATVRSASAGSRSTTSTRVPARASRMAAARPLPMPSPAAPPPAMMATLPARPAIVLGSRNRCSSCLLPPQLPVSSPIARLPIRPAHCAPPPSTVSCAAASRLRPRSAAKRSIANRRRPVSQQVIAELAPTGVLRAGINLSNFLLVTGKSERRRSRGRRARHGRARSRSGWACRSKYVPFKTPGELADAAEHRRLGHRPDRRRAAARGEDRVHAGLRGDRGDLSGAGGLAAEVHRRRRQGGRAHRRDGPQRPTGSGSSATSSRPSWCDRTRSTAPTSSSCATSSMRWPGCGRG